MTKQIYDNTSISAYRVFETLKFLLKQPASVYEIVQHLSSLEPDEKIFSRNVIYKYISTLEFAGIKISRHKCKYKITDLPFKINFTDENIHALYLLNYMLNITPEEKFHKLMDKIFYRLEIRQTSENKELFNNERSINYEIKLPTKEQILTLKEFEKYCNDKLKLSISYKDSNNKIQSITCNPIECKYEGTNVYLIVYTENPNNEIIELNSKQILQIEQTPLMCTSSNKYLSSTTVFKTKEKLTQRYILRNNETEINSTDIRERVISNKEEPKNNLLLRIMRYASQSDFLTPKKDRAKIREIIDKTLSNYNIN